MFFVIRFKSADGLIQQDFNPKEFQQVFGMEFNESHIVNKPLMEVYIPISSYPNGITIFNQPAQYRSYKVEKTLAEPIEIYNHHGKAETVYRKVVIYQEILK